MYIETPRLIIRPFTLEDANNYLKFVQDELIHKYVPFSYLNNIAEANAAILECYAKCDFSNDFYLLIIEKQSNNLIGALMITDNYYGQYYDSCYFIGKQYRRKGYMKEALVAFLNNFPLPDKKLMFFIKPSNTASLNLIKQIDGIIDVYPEKVPTKGPFKQFCYQT